MHIAFRPITRDDFPVIGRWLRDPQVAWWWNDDADPEALGVQYGPSIDGSDPTEVFITRIDGAEVGLIQRYRLHDEEEYIAELEPLVAIPDGAMSIDYLLADAVAGQGRGTTMIGAFVARLWHDHPPCPCLVVPVHADNRRSWRALERNGFRRVAEGDLTPDNPAHSPRHVIYRRDRPVDDDDERLAAGHQADRAEP